MIVLNNGPAAGEYPCNRAPAHLRAVTDDSGGRHILDHPDDVPEERESLHVYRMDGKPFTGNICGRGRCGAVERFASYSLVEDADTASLRDLGAWLEWCLEMEQEVGS